MANQVLTQDEINKVKELREQFFNLTNVVGNTEIQIMNLELQKEQLKQTLQQLQQQEEVFVQELEKKYGKGTISLETGEFIPTE